jgi:hypothetical protein
MHLNEPVKAFDEYFDNKLHTHKEKTSSIKKELSPLELYNILTTYFKIAPLKAENIVNSILKQGKGNVKSELNYSFQKNNVK